MTFSLSPKNLTPPLENGDRLTRPEFERRYHTMPEVKKAELIEGVVYMASPLRFTPHAEPHGDIMTWLGVYKAATPGVQMGIEPTVRLDMDNAPQPDGVLFIRPECGGQARLSEDGYLEGAPELIVEIAASSATIDLGDKKRAYRRNGVREYIVWQVCDRRLDWFGLTDGDYIPLTPNDRGAISSRIFPGLQLDVNALLAGNMAQVLTVLQGGLNTDSHQAFVRELSN
jgi:Uma2 family endonuclease